jgi:multidrug transporter EmrE-like cation transporter
MLECVRFKWYNLYGKPPEDVVMAAFLNTPLGKWTGIVIAVLTGAFAQAMMKLGTRQLGAFGDMPFFEYLLKLIFSPLILLAIASYGLGVVFYMFMLSRLDLSFLYPVMTALGLVIATIVSVILFHERISLTRLSGIAVMTIGVFLVSRS